MQPNVTIAESMPDVQTISSTEVFFPASDAIQSVVEQLETNSQSYRAALTEIQTRGLQVQDAATTAPTGWTIRDRSVLGEEVRSLTFCQHLGADQGLDMGLIGMVISGNDANGLPVRTEVFELVSKPSGGVSDLSAISVIATFKDGVGTTPAAGVQGIWSRFTSCVTSSCASVCLGSLTACAGVWPVYLKCVAVACGGCALKCGACAACDCSWWCKWAAGCCRG